MNKHPFLRQLSAIGLATLVMAGCQPAASPEPSDPNASQIEAFASMRAVREARLAEMSVRDLVAEMEADSERGLEPFNSMAVRELVTREGEAAAELASLLGRDPTSLLGLMALRQMDQKIYEELAPEQRLSILIDALSHSEYFNTWGIPDLYWEDAAQAVIELGNDAETALKPLLGDQRAAPVWGEEEFAHYELYQYRVADYALALTLAIRHDESPIPQAPADRDKMIGAL